MSISMSMGNVELGSSLPSTLDSRAFGGGADPEAVRREWGITTSSLDRESAVGIWRLYMSRKFVLLFRYVDNIVEVSDDQTVNFMIPHLGS